MYLNKVMLIGNLTRDPELKATPSGTKVASLSLATNRVWKDQHGTKQEDTEYHNVVVFGKQAETIAQYCKKGASLMLEGRLQTRSWDDASSGTKKYRTEIVLESFQFGPKPQGSNLTQTQERGAPVQNTAEDIDAIEYPDEEINLEDIPF